MKQIYSKLLAIQGALKAPKSQFNKFGGYKYRKAEDILEAVKPLAQEKGCLLLCNDRLYYLEGRFYIEATATLLDVESGESVSTTAYAREEEEKKGMDPSQVTGASSSYARKYALNGLLCIDDNADSDTTNDGTGTTTQGKGNGKTGGKKSGTQDGQQQPQAQQKEPAPARGSEEWESWVAAIATGAPSKTGKKVNWEESFKKHYIYTDDLLACLNEDVLNCRMAAGIPANA